MNRFIKRTENAIAADRKNKKMLVGGKYSTQKVTAILCTVSKLIIIVGINKLNAKYFS